MKKRTKKQISYNMSRIKSKNTSIEKLFEKYLKQIGLSYIKNSKKIEGKPDFAIPSLRIAIFCDSEIWHGYKWGRKFINSFKVRKTFWITKIKANMKRDKKVNLILRKQGWKVLRFWAKDIRKNTRKCINRLKKIVKGKK